jgi:hypothetical protein
LINFITPNSSGYTLSVTYNNFGLKVDDNIKFLAMYVDCHLNWNLQIEKLKKKMNTACYMLVVSVQVLKTIYLPHYQSQLEYGIVFWGFFFSHKKDIYCSEKSN